MVGVEVNLELRQGHLECATLAQPRVAGSTFASGIIAQVKIDPIRVEVVRGFDNIITGKDLCGCAARGRFLLRGRVFCVRVNWETLKQNVVWFNCLPLSFIISFFSELWCFVLLDPSFFLFSKLLTEISSGLKVRKFKVKFFMLFCKWKIS